MSTLFYRPLTKLREGYVFTGMCDSVHGGLCASGGGHACFRGGMRASWGACVLPGGGMHASRVGGVLPRGMVCVLPGGYVCFLGEGCASGGVCVLSGGHACFQGDVCASGGYVRASWGACMCASRGRACLGGPACHACPLAWYHEIWSVNERAVRIPLECVLFCPVFIFVLFFLLSGISLFYVINFLLSIWNLSTIIIPFFQKVCLYSKDEN